MANAQQSDDVKTLSDSLCALLSGELKVGAGLLKIGGALKREGRNTQWVQHGLSQWIEQNEDAIPIIVMALGEKGVEKLREWAERHPEN